MLSQIEVTQELVPEVLYILFLALRKGFHPSREINRNHYRTCFSNQISLNFFGEINTQKLIKELRSTGLDLF